MIYEFSDLTLDLDRHLLTRGGRPIKLTKLSFKVLQALVQAAPALISHDDLIDQVWGPMRVITPDNLSQRMKTLRQSLGDDPNQPIYIEGLRGEGYRLVSEVKIQSVRTSSHSSSRSSRKALSSRLVVSLVVLALSLGYIAFDKFVLDPVEDEQLAQSARQDGRTAARTESHGDISIAILPFDNRSNRAEDQFFTDGIHYDLLATIAKVGSMKVISRTSVMEYRGTVKNIPQIAQELGVANILVGGIQRSGNQVRINVQLIDAATDEYLWAEIYDRELTAENLFSVQSEITRMIANALQAELSTDEQLRIDTRPTDNLQAYEAYMRGRQFMATRNAAKLILASEEFIKATEIDPSFALAWVGVADSLGLSLGWRDARAEDLLPIIEDAVKNALVIDNDLGEAYVSQARIHARSGRYDESEEAYQKAIELSPNYATAYQWYSRLVGNDPLRIQESIDLMQKAAKLDPRSAIIGRELAGFNVADRFFLPGQQAVIQPGFATTSSQNSPVIRFTVPLGEGNEIYLGGITNTIRGRPVTTALALSNDGNLLVYSAFEEGLDGRNSRLYIRRLDQERADPIAGTEGAESVFISPDDNWIGFVARGEQSVSLRRVPVSGGNVETIVEDTGLLTSASWGDDGTIVYSSRRRLYQVAATGGSGVLIADPSLATNQRAWYAQPFLLPGSKMLLFHSTAKTLDPQLAEIVALDLNTGTQTTLLSNAMEPHYVAETGHLLFMRQGSLMAVGFDPDQVAIEGEPVMVQEDVMQAVGAPNSRFETGVAQLSISSSGHLAYAAGGVFSPFPGMMMRVAQDGEAEPLLPSTVASSLVAPRVSPTGDRLAYRQGRGRGGNIVVYDLERDVAQLLKTSAFRNQWPTWSPDGKSIAFTATQEDGIGNIYSMAADGSDESPRRLAASDRAQQLMSWSRDGVIAYLEGGDIWMLPPDEEPRPFFTSDSLEYYASFSPDGKWLAYGVDHRRQDLKEVYIRPYPGSGPAILISGNGSAAPAWSHDGTQLYFTQRNSSLGRTVMMVVDVLDGSPSRARSLIDPWIYAWTVPGRNYDVLPDGSFVAATTEIALTLSEEELQNTLRQRQVTELHVVLNFVEELRRRMVDY